MNFYLILYINRTNINCKIHCLEQLIDLEIIDGYNIITNYNGFFRFRQGKSSNINVFLIVLRFIDDE